MRAFSLILIAFAFALGCVAQNQVPELYFEKRGGVRKKFLKEGSRVKVVMMDGTKYRGRFNVFEDKIVLEDQLINLNQIDRIRIRNTESIIIGATMVVGGSPILATGGYVIAQSLLTNDECARSCGLLVGPPLLVAAGALLIPGVFILTLGLKHSHEDWVFSIRNPEKPELNKAIHNMFAPETYLDPE
ncbi:MAG: hypothetical protein R2813_03960 [Flavobacteriales bacterium]